MMDDWMRFDGRLWLRRGNHVRFQTFFEDWFKVSIRGHRTALKMGVISEKLDIVIHGKISNFNSICNWSNTHVYQKWKLRKYIAPIIYVKKSVEKFLYFFFSAGRWCRLMFFGVNSLIFRVRILQYNGGRSSDFFSLYLVAVLCN